MVTKGIVAGLVSYLTMLGTDNRRARWARLPMTAVLAAIAATLSQPLGLHIQEHVTTPADMRDLRIVDIRRQSRWGQVTHFITTSG